MSSLKLFFLGSPRIEQGGQLAEVDTRKAMAMLAYLALTGERQSRDFLAAFLWPEFDDSHAKAALRRTLSTLKTAVGDTGLHISREAIGLETGSYWCDVVQFRQHIATQELETAVALYRDNFMAGFSLRDSLPFDDWQLQQTEQLRRELSGALEQLVKYASARHDFASAIAHARRWLQLDPLREEAHCQLMRLTAWTGQRAAALRQYRDCVRILEDELGVPPLPETTLLYESIRNDILEEPQPTQPDEGLSLSLPGIKPAVPTTASPTHFVGRTAELALMEQLYQQTGPDGRFLVIAGEAGIGKTRLAEHFLAAHPDAAHLSARCFHGESFLAYAPFVQAIRSALSTASLPSRQEIDLSWLAEASRLLPELTTRFPGLPDPPPLDWPGAPGRFLEGISHLLEWLLAGAVPGILWLDDMQWADSASLDLLAFLVRRWRGRPFLLLVCWRDADLPADHRLHHLLAESRREGSSTLITLGRWQAADVAELVAAAIQPQPGAAALAERLYAETEGLPFLVTAYLQAPLKTMDSSSLWALPATVRDLFQMRLGQTSEMARQLLQTAAIVGRTFGFELVQAASGRSEDETLLALEELLAQQLLVAQTGQLTYDFSHHKLRELVYEEMNLVRRRLLHRRVAQSLSTSLGNEASSGQIASHFQAAGLDGEAAVFYRQAGDEAQTLFAHREALAHYQAALALGYPDTAVLYEACGGLHIRLGEYTAALASYERAAAVAEPSDLPRLEHKLGQVYYRRGEWSLAQRYFERAEIAWLEMTVPHELARLYIDWSGAAFRAGDLPLAIQLAAKAQELADDLATQAQVHNVLGMLARHQGNLMEAVVQFNQSLTLAQAQSLLGVQITAMNNLALTEISNGRLDEAQNLLIAALAHCQTYGDRHWEAALHNNLADLLNQRGQKEEAMTELKQAVAIYAEIGQETGQWQPEIWKLSEW